MRIGYTTLDDIDNVSYLRLIGNCEHVKIMREKPYTVDHFLDFLSCHRKDNIIVTNFESINLSLNHYKTIAQHIDHYNIQLHFLEKETETDEEYLKILSGISNRNTVMMSRRTLAGLERAKKIGTVGGRPTIAKETINQIQKLYSVHKKPMREIAKLCEVSLGTVHKYKDHTFHFDE